MSLTTLNVPVDFAEDIIPRSLWRLLRGSSVPIALPKAPTSPHVLADDRVFRDRVIVSIGPAVYAVHYAVRLTELKGVAQDASSRVTAMTKFA